MPGQVEVDGTCIDGEEAGLVGGLAEGKKALVAVAVEVTPRRGSFGVACKLSRTLRPQPCAGSSGECRQRRHGHHGRTDGPAIWDCLHWATRLTGTAKAPPRPMERTPASCCPGVHRIATLAKSWLLDKHQVAVGIGPLSRYLDEFCLRVNGRKYTGCLVGAPSTSSTMPSRCAVGSTCLYSSIMTTMGTWLVLIGSALAVLQAVWVIVGTGRQRTRLQRGKAHSDSRESRISELKDHLRERWGDDAADISNYEQLPGYQADPELDGLRAELARLLDQRAADDWVLTYAAVEREKARNARELDEVEGEWRRLWTQGVPGLLGGVMALVGGVLTSFGVS